jgi:hypothetical protein
VAAITASSGTLFLTAAAGYWRKGWAALKLGMEEEREDETQREVATVREDGEHAGCGGGGGPPRPGGGGGEHGWEGVSAYGG